MILFLSVLFCFGLSPLAQATTAYIEAGTSLGRMTSADKFFQQASAQDTGSGFVGSFSLYYPVTSLRRIVHIDLGIQNRLNLNSTTLGESLAMASINLAARIEFYRFFVGGGYSPIDFVSKTGEGASSLHTYPNSHSYFVEGGVIWRVVPELQICAVYALEFGTTPAGSGPNPASEYGLRFRFPLDPHEAGGKGAVKFDGYRYPFGVMK